MDILDYVAIRLPCRRCGQKYDVPLRDVHISHAIMEHGGCPVAEDTECPPIAQIWLAEDDDVVALQRTWRRLQERAEKDSGELVLMQPCSPTAAAPKPLRTKTGRSDNQCH